MKVIGYYTKDSYEEDAVRFKKSLDKVGMEYYIKELDYSNDWKKANQYKPQFIKECRDKFKGKLLYIDVDAVVHQNCHQYFDSLNCDFAIHWFQGPMIGYERRNDNVILGGTLFFADNERVRFLLQQWVYLNNYFFALGDPPRGDQTSLDYLLRHKVIQGLKVENMLGRYCYVFDKSFGYPKEEPRIIEHLIASRENKGHNFGKINLSRQNRLKELENE